MFYPLKSLFLEEDLHNFFINKLSNLENDIHNNEINRNEVINIIQEINKYNFSNINSSEILASLNYEDPYNYGISLYDSGNFLEAYNTFSSISPNNKNYTDALEYMNNCKSYIKDNTLDEVNDLRNKDYYSKAINLLDNFKDILGYDKDIDELISQIQKEKSEYIQNNGDNTVLTSSSVINKITSTNINTLSIESLTNYIIYVDINMQRTFVYYGSKNNWSLLKKFTCSTGINGEETPSGVFTVKEKGDWFFSNQYNQGGKYWVQFSGDYLFHSLPYSKDKKTVVDYTLGTPSSHGCIRLLESDSKWIYDTVPRNSKVIIK